MKINLKKTAFWDINLSELNEQEHAAFIIARVFQYGFIDDIKSHYKPTDIKMQFKKQEAFWMKRQLL